MVFGSYFLIFTEQILRMFDSGRFHSMIDSIMQIPVYVLTVSLIGVLKVPAKSSFLVMS